MLTRKEKNRFNAIIISKSNIFRFSILICIIILFFSILSFDFIKNNMYILLREQIPIIQISQYNIKKSPQKDFKILYSYSVLAEVLPMIHNKVNNDVENINVTDNETISSFNNENHEYVKHEKTFPIVPTINKSDNLSIKNETTYQLDKNMLVTAPLSFRSPEILIVHTHASEAYSESDESYYNENETNRTTDTNYNVVRVGEELANELIKYGMRVTHAKEINDYPSYNQSYKKTLEVINNNLINNPNIQIVLDIHRDAVIKNDGTKYKFLTEINGEKVAQLMIVCGTNQAGLSNDTWQENLKFALKLQKYMETNFPGLARPLNLRQERFNTHATLGSIIIEVGTSGNTLNEALNSIKYLAKTIKEVLKPYG